MCSGRAGAVPGRNRVPGTGSGNWFREPPGFDGFRQVLRFQGSGSEGRVKEVSKVSVFDGFRGVRFCSRGFDGTVSGNRPQEPEVLRSFRAKVSESYSVLRKYTLVLWKYTLVLWTYTFVLSKCTLGRWKYTCCTLQMYFCTLPQCLSKEKVVINLYTLQMQTSLLLGIPPTLILNLKQHPTVPNILSKPAAPAAVRVHRGAPGVVDAAAAREGYGARSSQGHQGQSQGGGG